jgi:WD40 repeat protein
MRSAVVLFALVLAFLQLSTWNPLAAPSLSAWGTPVNLGPVVNSPFLDGGAGISRNGLSLYFHSNRPGGFGDTDIWVSRRASAHDPWGPPVNLGPNINTSFAETVPTISRDGHWMFFASARPGGQGGIDIWASRRTHTHDDFGWQPPLNLGPNVNSAVFDAGPTYLAGHGVFPPTLFFVSTRPGGFGGNDVYASELLLDGVFGPSTHVSELSSPSNDNRPTIRRDGQEIIFFSNRPGGVGGNDLWVSTRASLGSGWTLPENLGPIVNSADDEFQPQLSSDRKMLVFSSNRPGGFGDYDLYLTVRSKPGKDGRQESHQHGWQSIGR